MTHLLESADDLIECLRALKEDSTDPSLRQRMAKLSRKVLPSFQNLADEAAESLAAAPIQSKVEIPLLTAWTPSEVKRELPPLPPVLNPSLERASFTHAAMVKNRGDHSYEQLEWLGDAYLYLIATAYIYLTFPHLRHGDMAQIREVLVRNATLKDYSLQYGFDKRGLFPPEYGLNGREGGTKVSSKERAKVLGDIFEAHVAAIILSDPVSGVSKTAKWLKALWSTTIPKQIEKRMWQGQAAPALVVPVMGATPTETSTSKPATASQQPPPLQSTQDSNSKDALPAKVKLQAELSLHEPRVAIEYRSLGNGKKDPLTKQTLFTQGAYLVGYGETVQLGTGTDQKKARANERAAQMALENKKLMKVYREKKLSAQESKRAAQQEASNGLGF